MTEYKLCLIWLSLKREILKYKQVTQHQGEKYFIEMKNIIIEIKSPTYMLLTSRSEVTKEGISELSRPKKIFQNSGQNMTEIEI